jgi:hypothetical protein
MLQETEERQLRWIAELLGRLQNVTDRGKGGATNHSIHERMGFGTARKEETSRTNVSIERSGVRGTYVFALRKTVFTETFV